MQGCGRAFIVAQLTDPALSCHTLPQQPALKACDVVQQAVCMCILVTYMISLHAFRPLACLQTSLLSSLRASRYIYAWLTCQICKTSSPPPSCLFLDPVQLEFTIQPSFAHGLICVMFQCLPRSLCMSHWQQPTPSTQLHQGEIRRPSCPSLQPDTHLHPHLAQPRGAAYLLHMNGDVQQVKNIVKHPCCPHEALHAQFASSIQSNNENRS